MDLVPALVLRVLHFLYALISLFHSFWKRQTRPHPQLLQSPRRRLPKNLALVFVADVNIPTDIVEKTILQSILNAVEWCRTVGILKLTLYEEHGLILQLEPRIREAVFGQDHELPSSDSEIEYQPLTPPESVCSESRSLSPCHSTLDITEATILQSPLPKIRNRKNKSSLVALPSQRPISLCLLSSGSSKAAVANLARSLYLDHKQKPRTTGLRIKKTFELKVDDMDELLENNGGLSSPDFMIVHPINPLQYNRTPLELHAFPPWHIRLTEIHLNQNKDQPRAWRDWLQSRLTYAPSPTILDEISFRDALDQFGAAEMRFGK